MVNVYKLAMQTMVTLTRAKIQLKEKANTTANTANTTTKLKLLFTKLNPAMRKVYLTTEREKVAVWTSKVKC